MAKPKRRKRRQSGEPSRKMRPKARPKPRRKAQSKALTKPRAKPRSMAKARPAPAPPQLSHIDQRGQARMVDVGGKGATERMAVAEGRVIMSKATLDRVLEGNALKGDVWARRALPASWRPSARTG